MSKLLLAVAVAWLVVACSAAPPEILYPDAQLYLRRDQQTGTTIERVRLFVAVDDPDGADDPATLYVVHDGAGLYWEIDSEEWVTIKLSGDTWYGVPELRMTDGDPLPRGLYRIIVEDRALARDEAEFFLTAEPLGASVRFPLLERTPAGLGVDYDAPVTVRVYDPTGRMIVNRIVSPGLFPSLVQSEIPDESGYSIFLSAVDGAIRVESGPYSAQ